MKRCVQTDLVFLVMELLTGDEVRAIDAAKQMIAQAERIDPELLVRIVRDPGYRRWSKVMAAYVLGFLPLTAGANAASVLRVVLADPRASISLRTHAAEALGNLKDEGATSLLAERLLDAHEPASVRKWCLYALQELGSADALQAIHSFAETEPQGALRRELVLAGL